MFFKNLKRAISSQLGFGESTNQASNNLGGFENNVDRSAQRMYLEDGLVNNSSPRVREIVWQQPDISIIVKKKAFSSISDNFKEEYLEKKERLYLKACKKLFQNKCRVIALYEQLTKIDRVIGDSGELNSYLMPDAVNLIDILSSKGVSIMGADTRSAVSELRKALALSNPAGVTTWITDVNTGFHGDKGEGTGVIEFTTCSTFSSTVATQFGKGSASLIFEDPYNIMRISENDIEQAISDSLSQFSGGFIGFAKTELENLIRNEQQELHSLRADRNASTFTFKINENTLLSKKLRVIIQDTGEEVSFSYDPGFIGFNSKVELSNEIDALNANNNLTNKEKKVLKKVIEHIYDLIGLVSTSRAEIKRDNVNTNYIRRKMKEEFEGMALIQPMDVVNVFIQSRTSNDDKNGFNFSTNGSGNRYNIGQTINNLINNINNIGGSFGNYNGTSFDIDDVEMKMIAGPDFPSWLWHMFKDDFKQQKAGTSVFVGVVNDVSQGFSDGKNILNISCGDNASYFNKSAINLKPAVDVFNGQLYDPLTPYDVSFDASTGAQISDIGGGVFPPLLEENLKLLASGKVKVKNGRFRGEALNDIIYKMKDKEQTAGGEPRQSSPDPDGFVYRWKEGISTVTETARVNDRLRIDKQRKSPILTKNPFAGQDVMNVISLLVTGQPYNFNTFLKAAISNANSQSSDGASYIDGVLSDLNKRNEVWGNFVPFKKLVVGDRAASFINSGQANLTTLNNGLNRKIRKRAELQDQLAIISSNVNSLQQFPKDEDDQILPRDSFSQAEGVIRRQIAALNREISDLENNFNNSVKNDLISNKNGVKIIGNDISFDPSLTGFSQTASQEEINRQRIEFRKKIDAITLRRNWNVKANNDNNLFIVDDQYDKNFDIQAFERSIGPTFNLFASEYLTIDGQISSVASLLGLEIFANSQGHIVCRPPAYNRVPSSILSKMLRDKVEKGIQVYPQFIEGLFFNQLRGLIEQIEIVEDHIRLRGLALGLGAKNATDPDSEIKRFLRTRSDPGFANDGINGNFTFLSDSNSDGRIGTADFRILLTQSNPEVSAGKLSPLKEVSNRVANASQQNVIFDAPSRSTALSELNDKKSYEEVDQAAVEKVRTRLARKTGVKIPTISDLFSNEKFGGITGSVSQIDIINIFEQISQFVSERQILVNQLSAVMRNINNAADFNDSSDSAIFPALNGFLGKDTAIPDFMAHMIEDESDNSLGPGSGDRFIIKDKNIISLTIKETPPDYTMVQVNGLFAEGFVPGLTKGSVENSGNILTSAQAVDFDLWRRYGFKASKAVEAPFFSDPDTQCAPYAVYLLNLARKNIIKGSLTVVGNEYYQGGDVIYIESRNLLFYVDTVQQSFSYSNGSYQTTLNLTFGHPPGVYIPTMLDVVGGSLYNSKGAFSGYRSNRFGNSNGDIPVGAVIYPNTSTENLESFSIEDILSGNVGEHNKKTLLNMLTSVSRVLAPSSNSGIKPMLELRLYTVNEFGDINPFLEDAANSVVGWFKNPQESFGESILPIKIDAGISQNASNIRVKKINLDEDDSGASPSSLAWNSVRLIESNPGPVSLSQTSFIGENFNELSILSNHIIDAWIVFDEVEVSTAETSVATKNKNARTIAEEKALADAEKRGSNG